MPEPERIKCLKGKMLYLENKASRIEKLGIDKGLYNGFYLLLSSYVHTFPIGFYRIGDRNRGRGVENSVDRKYINSCMEAASFFLIRGAKEMIHLFPGTDLYVSESALSVLGESSTAAGK